MILECLNMVLVFITNIILIYIYEFILYIMELSKQENIDNQNALKKETSGNLVE